ncbi:DUF2193 domain-containing protein [Caldinitratiruptor microaerophilus]|uniref:Uncharacterized protein n=1 Tax=Caldinitratiruptor microaerophilus TaxID=671077 RepID=A0AA35G9M8_9FIRM|nr:DUF2193 domain-containing protein [Caldinitratiruptor microaerophilus]BDG60454.1 hypothetical protein caldi_15440 [Caldinitratiruptor microaerophilus]
MASQKLFENMVRQAMAAVWADVKNIKQRRGTQFKITDAQPYVDAVNQMVPTEEQSKEVFDLHIQSVNAHYEILKSLTETVRPEDDPFVEHYQTPAILEILYEEDPAFRQSVERFIQAIAEEEALIGRESVRRYGGVYGPVAGVDFALSPGSTANVFNAILSKLDIPKVHKETILASKSFGMNTSYCLGEAFQGAIESGKTLGEAIKAEIEMLQLIYDQPIAAQNKLMASHNLGGHGPHSSFDTNAYMQQYKQRMRPVVQAALAAGVHPGNICAIPAYCVGDVAHHNSQSMFNFAQDPIVMAMLEAHTQALENTLNRGLEKGFNNEYGVLSLATGTGAALLAYELLRDAMPIPSFVQLLVDRYHNLVAMNPGRGAVAELHNVDMIMSLHRGWRILKPKPMGGGGEIGGVPVDFRPLDEHEILANPHRWTYPGCAITQRAAAIMKLSDFPCLLTSEPVTATLLTHVAALHKETAIAPLRIDKDWGVTDYRITNMGLVRGFGANPRSGYDGYAVPVHS